MWIVALTAKLPASGRHGSCGSNRSNAGGDLDLEIETREPIDAGGPSQLRRIKLSQKLFGLLAIRTHNNAIRLHKIINRSAFFQELRI